MPQRVPQRATQQILAPVSSSLSPAPRRRGGLTLLGQALGVLGEAVAEQSAAERFRLAHLAALRCAAALFAERARPSGGHRRPTNAWVLLASVAPELSDWASYFAAGASQRAAVEAGAVHAVTAREADDLVRAVEQFLVIVESSIGLLAVPFAS
jgi:SAV_6107-like HEPN